MRVKQFMTKMSFKLYLICYQVKFLYINKLFLTCYPKSNMFSYLKEKK